MTIKEDDYNKALATVRQAINAGELTGSTAGKSHVVHGRGTVPDHYGTELISQVEEDGGSPELVRKLKKIMGL